jgi:hypothetical protein
MSSRTSGPHGYDGRTARNDPAEREKQHAHPGSPDPVGALGGTYLLDGRLGDATRIAQEGLAAARQRGERGVESQLLRSSFLHA